MHAVDVFILQGLLYMLGYRSMGGLVLLASILFLFANRVQNLLGVGDTASHLIFR